MSAVPEVAGRQAVAGRRLTWQWQVVVSWGLMALAMVAGLVGVPDPTRWAWLFFAAVFFAGGLAVAGLAGRSVQLGLAVVVLLLVVVQRGLARPVAEPPSSQWTQALQGPEQEIRHTISVPVGAVSLLRQREGVMAAVYVCARSPLAEQDGLELYAGETLVGLISEAQASGPRPEPTRVGFYRMPVERALVERAGELTFRLRRRPGAAPRAVDVCGTFTYRPSAGLESSRFFDGVSWWSPGETQQGRFTIELRLEDERRRVLQVIY
ncbi:MAG TPA: hypothetical protein VHS99_23855 [Chloroflexota bacterium]|nr:hypothetical protein [Chloroflexota bacterium]